MNGAKHSAKLKNVAIVFYALSAPGRPASTTKLAFFTNGELGLSTKGVTRKCDVQFPGVKSQDT